MIIPVWAYVAGGGALLVTGFASGWTVNGWRHDAAANAALEASIEGLAAATTAVNDVAADYETGRGEVESVRTEVITNTREVYRDIEVPANCAVQPDALRLLDDTRRRANAIASGQSSGPLFGDSLAPSTDDRP